MINRTFNRFAALAVLFVLALAGKANAQSVSVSGAAIAPGNQTVTCSLLAYVNGTTVTGNAKFQFATCYFTGYSEMIGTPTVDSKGTIRNTIRAYGWIINNATNASVKTIATVYVTQAPGSKGSVMLSFSQYDTAMTLAANLATPGAALTSTALPANVVLTLRTGGTSLTE
jgi:hypothetical protein